MHVVSEKPVASTPSDGRQIVERARHERLIYQIGFNRRWAPSYRYLKERINAGFVSYSANVKMNDGT